MHATAPAAPSTLESFLAWEEAQPERFELAGGVVRTRAGGTEDHDRVSGNIGAALRARLRGTPCSAHLSNLKVLSRGANAVPPYRTKSRGVEPILSHNNRWRLGNTSSLGFSIRASQTARCTMRAF